MSDVFLIPLFVLNLMVEKVFFGIFWLSGFLTNLSVLIPLLALVALCLLVSYFRERRKITSLVLFILIAPSLHAWWRDDDRRQYRQPDFKQYQAKDHSFKFSRDLFEGAWKGEFKKDQNLTNILGSIAINFTLAAPLADARDVAANVVKSYKADFKEYKADIALAGFGFLPVIGETAKFKKAFEMGREMKFATKAIDVAATGAPFVRNLPDMQKLAQANPDEFMHVLKSFETPPVQKTFKAGDTVYRIPTAGEDAFAPGRFFGTSASATSLGADRRFNINAYGNPNEIQRTYEFKKDTTVYYGKVANGNGYQAYIPKDIFPEEALKWTGLRTLR